MGAGCSIRKGNPKSNFHRGQHSPEPPKDDSTLAAGRALESSTGISDFGRAEPSNASPPDCSSVTAVRGSMSNIPEEAAESRVAATASSPRAEASVIVAEERSKTGTTVKMDSTAPSSPNHSSSSTYEKISTTRWFPEAIRGMPDISKRLLVGAPGEHWPTDDKVIRILHIVNRSDSQTERQALLEKVYPKVQEACLRRGYELEIIDPYWGACIQDENDDRLRNLKSRSIIDVAERDPNLIVTVFLNEKYGSWTPPVELPVGAFESLYETLSDTDKALLRSFYVRDESACLTRYVKRPLAWQGGDAGSGEKAKWDSRRQEDLYHLTNIFVCNTSQDFQQKYLISELEIDIERVVLNPTRRTDNVIWIHRKFNFMRFDKRQSHAKFTDVNKQGVRDEVAKNKLQSLENRLNARVDPNNELDMDVNWAQGGLTRSIKEHSQYLDAVCHHYQYIIEETVDRVLEEKQKFDSQLVRFQGFGLPVQFNLDLRHHMSMANRYTAGFVGHEEKINQVCRYLFSGPSTDAPMLVHGPTGSGKSAILAGLLEQIGQGDRKDKSACVYRHVSASPNDVTEDTLLAGICQQLCILLGLHSTIAHKISVADPDGFCGLLEKVSSRFNLYIILDGLDHLQWPTSPSFTWIPSTLPSDVKMILSATTDSHAYRVLQARAGNSLLVDGMTEVEMKPLVHEFSRQRGLQIRSHDEARLCEHIRNPLHLQVLLETLTHLHVRSDTVKECIKDTIEEQVTMWLDLLGKLFPVTLIGHCIQFLLLSRQGLSDVEMTDLLKSAGLPKLDACCSRLCSNDKLPQHIWLRIKSCLEPFLMRRTVEGRLLNTWRHDLFRHAAKSFSPQLEDSCQTIILQYFQGNTSFSDAESYKDANTILPAMFKPQTRTYGRMVNVRHLLEVPHHMIRSTKDVTLLAEYLLDLSALEMKLKSVGVYPILQDLDTLQEEHCLMPDISHLRQILAQRRSIFARTSVHLKSALHSLFTSGQISEASTPLLYRMCAKIASSRAAILFSECRVRDVYESMECPAPLLHAVYRITGNQHHCVSVATREGVIKIWHIASRRAVRTLTGVTEPRNVKVLDRCRAVVLSGRQLVVLDLDRGVITCKVKGVLNLKRCYYDVVDKDHIIALSRNRMCVNLMDANTGDVIATFKAGEDRFLNSLLVSGNGERCVCGDDVESPFPLLVWDLPKRKLTLDLRIPGHEFLTNMAAITDDGHYAVCVCKDIYTADNNFLIVYDLMSGAIYKKWKPNHKTTCVAISSASALVVSAHEDGSLIVWDLVSGAKSYEFDGHADGVDTIRMSENGCRCLSYDSKGRDLAVILHDLRTGACLGAYSTEYGFTSCELSGDGKRVLLCVPGEESLQTLRCTTDAPTSEQELESEVEAIFGDASRQSDVIEVTKEVPVTGAPQSSGQ